MAGQFIDMKAADGSGGFRGYLATPSGGSGPGLVLAQEIFGVNSTMREVADYYAEEGYVVLVPDLFWRQQPSVELGYTPEDWQKAFGFFQGFNEAKGMEDMQTAITTLRARPEVSGKSGGGRRDKGRRQPSSQHSVTGYSLAMATNATTKDASEVIVAC